MTVSGIISVTGSGGNKVQSVSRNLAFTGQSSLRAKLAVTVIGLGLAFPAFANAAPCVANDELAPLQVRILQTELMVAALTCNQRTDYNSFVTRFQPQLSSHGKSLQSFFKQKYGSGSARALNGFVTRIANESSRRGMLKRGQFCHDTAAIHTNSKEIAPSGLPAFAKNQRFASLHGITPCPVKVAAQ